MDAIFDKNSIFVAPSTWGIRQSNDYVSTVRLVNTWFLWNGWWSCLYTHIKWSIQTCMTTLAITSTSHSHHIFNITFPDHLRSNTGNSFQKLLNASSRLFRPCPFNTCLFHACPFYPFRSIDVDTISFLWFDIFANVIFWCQAYVPLYIP